MGAGMGDPPQETEVTGTVKYVDEERGYGFIGRDDKQPKVFIHMRTINEAGYADLLKGQRWRFDVTRAPDGRIHAVNPTLLP